LSQKHNIPATCLFSELSDILKKVEGYASHFTSLFLRGYQTEMPDELTVICKKTSKDKVVAGINIKFFSIYDIPAKKTQLCTYNSQSFITSTIEQTLIDFVAHYGINASCTQIGNLFFRLPYDIDLLIRTAATQSDTYLKRVMFYLAWSGRGTWKDFPAFLKKVPVKLFPKLDEKQAQTSWNGEIFIKYPTAIMLQAPEGDLPVIDTEIARRVEIVCYKPFREYFAKKSILPIFHAPYMVEQLPEFFMLMLSKANTDQNSFFEQLSADNRKPAFPAAFLEWLAKTACESYQTGLLKQLKPSFWNRSIQLRPKMHANVCAWQCFYNCNPY